MGWYLGGGARRLIILVDTSVWSDYLTGSDNKHTNALDSALEDGTVAIGDLIFPEILQGLKSDRDFRRAKATLESLDQYEMPGRKLSIKSAENYRALRKKGIAIRKTNDVIVATFSIENRIPFLFSDRDFAPFVKYLGLRAVVWRNVTTSGSGTGGTLACDCMQLLGS